MSRRIEVELTSQRDDGTWTWRAAGAKQPKGALDGTLLYDGAGVGDVVRAEADFEIDGIFVTAVIPPKARSGRPEAQRLELRGGSHVDGVTTQLVPGRQDRDRGPDNRRRKRGGDGGGDGRRDRDRGQRSGRSDRQRDRTSPRAEGERGPRNRDAERRRDSAPARPRPKKLRPGQAHRRALVDELPEEQRVIADTLIRGGMAAVRQEIDAQNERATSDGGTEVAAGPLIALAESLLPGIRHAEWRDRADAAIAGLEEIDLRDLRAVLVAADDEARSPEARSLADQLRDGLNARVERAQGEWHAELRTILGEGRVVRALRLASRPPKAGAPLPPDIAEQLTAQANDALIGEITQQRLGIVLEAIAFSPIRPYVVLPAVPEQPEPELLEVVTKISDRLPEIAQRFGIAPSRRRRGRGRGPQGNKPPAAPDGTTSSDSASENNDPPPAETKGADTVDDTTTHPPAPAPSDESHGEATSDDGAEDQPTAEASQDPDTSAVEAGGGDAEPTGTVTIDEASSDQVAAEGSREQP